MLRLALILSCLGGSALAGPLQDMIDAADEGAEIAPPAGVYAEHITITKPIVLDGSAGVIIDGGGTDTVVTLTTDGATLKNLTIRNSGTLHNNTDAAVKVKGSFNVLRDLSIEQSLFGIDLSESHNNILRRNHIRSYPGALELQGDSIRLWSSNDNKIEGNILDGSRDFVIWYSTGNQITGNTVRNGRYGVHFMYAHNNTMKGNELADCVVGVFLMYSNDNLIESNRILRAWGASGMGVGFKETSGARIVDNDIIGNAVGIYIDISPFEPDETNEFDRNRIAYNGIGVEFHTDWEGNNFAGNAFTSNFTQVSVRGRGTAQREGWHGNYWDDYAGFDRAEPIGTGDQPHEIWTYADQIWMERPHASFFRGGLALATLDFVERLAPLSEPRLLLREAAPLMNPPATGEELTQ